MEAKPKSCYKCGQEGHIVSRRPSNHKKKGNLIKSSLSPTVSLESALMPPTLVAPSVEEAPPELSATAAERSATLLAAALRLLAPVETTVEEEEEEVSATSALPRKLGV